MSFSRRFQLLLLIAACAAMSTRSVFAAPVGPAALMNCLHFCNGIGNNFQACTELDAIDPGTGADDLRETGRLWANSRPHQHCGATREIGARIVANMSQFTSDACRGKESKIQAIAAGAATECQSYYARLGAQTPAAPVAASVPRGTVPLVPDPYPADTPAPAPRSQTQPPASMPLLFTTPPWDATLEPETVCTSSVRSDPRHRGETCCSYSFQNEIQTVFTARADEPARAWHGIDLEQLRQNPDICPRVRQFRSRYGEDGCRTGTRRYRGSARGDIELNVYRARLLGAGCAVVRNARAATNCELLNQEILRFGGPVPDSACRYEMTTANRCVRPDGSPCAAVSVAGEGARLRPSTVPAR